jgi:hypothetical protein
MTRDTTGMTEALSEAEVYPFFAVELMFDTRTIDFGGEAIEAGPLYFWTGLGDLTIGDITYTGTGSMLQISEVKETADIAAAGATLTLSGIPTEILALALQEPYQGRLCYIKFGMIGANKDFLLKQDGSFILLEDSSAIDISTGDPNVLTTLFTGYMDQMAIEEGPDTSIISLAVESKLIDLDRPRVQRYTSASQKARYANDLAFDFIPDLQDKPLSWGRKA